MVQFDNGRAREWQKSADTVKCGKSGLTWPVGTKFRDSPARAEFSICGSTPERHRKLPLHRQLARAVESVFKGLNFVPTRPASPDSPHPTVYTVLPGSRSAEESL